MGALGILAVHGLTATPREFDVIRKYLPGTFYCVTLNGHATTPSDLCGVTKEDWYNRVKENYEAMKDNHTHTLFLGMSTGSLLLLALASTLGDDIDGVVSVAAPLYLRNKISRAGLFTLDKLPRRMMRWNISNDSEHPEQNYTKMPVSAPLEMRAGSAYVRAVARNITAPSLLVSNLDDPTVLEPRSTSKLEKLIPDTEKLVFEVPYHNLVNPPTGYDDNIPRLIAEKIMKKWYYF